MASIKDIRFLKMSLLSPIGCPPVTGATWIGNMGQENSRLSYCYNHVFNTLEFYDLYSIFGNALLETKLAALITKARSVYGIQNIACIMGVGQAGFQLALNYNASHPTAKFNIFNKENEFWNGMIVEFTVTAANNFNYIITINGISYPFLSGTGQTATTIATGLAASILSGGLPAGLALVTSAGAKITIKADRTQNNNLGYTYSNSANIVAAVTQETFVDWIASIAWLKPQLSVGQTISAYIANYLTPPSWGATQAAQMVQYIDMLECARFTNNPVTAEQELSPRVLHLIADAAFAAGKNQNIAPVFSAEYPYDVCPLISPFMGNYLWLNGIERAEHAWLTTYMADNFANKASLHVGKYCYFDYRNLSIHVP